MALPVGIVPLLMIIIHFALLYGAWQAFRKIPDHRYTPWLLPSEPSDVPMPLMQHMRIRLRVRMLHNDSLEKRVTLSMPPKMTVGNLFSHFVQQGRKVDPTAFEYDDVDDRPFGWEFYATGWRGLSKRILDPDKSLLDNKLESYSVVIAKRINF